jgi:hypothetical protein
MLNGPLRDIGVLLSVYECTRSKSYYEPQYGDGAALRRLGIHGTVLKIPGKNLWTTTPYGDRWLKNFANLARNKHWWDAVGFERSLSTKHVNPPIDLSKPRYNILDGLR